jgi:hypothetical protein
MYCISSTSPAACTASVAHHQQHVLHQQHITSSMYCISSTSPAACTASAANHLYCKKKVQFPFNNRHKKTDENEGLI